MVNIGSGLVKVEPKPLVPIPQEDTRAKAVLTPMKPRTKADPGVIQIVRKYMATKKHHWAKPNTQPDYLLCVGLLKKYGEDEP
jgi:hypothetical protein